MIRVDENGQATVIGKPKTVSVTEGSEPTEFEKRAFVRLFLECYLNFSPTNVSRNWADSLNMMSANLRRTAFSGIQKENLLGKIENDQTSSEFQLRSLEISKDDPLTYTAFGVKRLGFGLVLAGFRALRRSLGHRRRAAPEREHGQGGAEDGSAEGGGRHRFAFGGTASRRGERCRLRNANGTSNAEP